MPLTYSAKIIAISSLREVNPRILQFPSSEPHSNRYRKLFNEVSRELGFDITWTHKHPGSPTPNIPDLERGEIMVSVKRGAKTIYQWPSVSSPKLSAAIEQIRLTIEARRQTVATISLNQNDVLPNPSLSKMERLNRVERFFVEHAASPLQEIAHRIFGKQSHPHFETILEWMERFADPASLDHFRRICAEGILPINPRFQPFPDWFKYASSLPWFPEGYPTYNAMWPADLTEAEFEYFCNTYPKEHPVLSPHTVVERISRTEATEWELHPPLHNTLGEQVEWVVEGLNHQYFKVTNIAHHPRFQSDFLEAAAFINGLAELEIKGEPLTPSFRDYLFTAAQSLVTGNFTEQLKRDLALTTENLFFIFFQLEGYWPDNMKFPISFEIGIRELELPQKIHPYLVVIPELAHRTHHLAATLGLSIEEEPISLEVLASQVQLVWLIRAGGMMRGLVGGDPDGHDYPKAAYPGISTTTYRTVSLLQGIYGERPSQLQSHLLTPQDIAKITPEIITRFVVLHELGHRLIGNRPDTPTLKGRLGTVFGEFWGTLVEPMSDLFALAAYERLFEVGVMSWEACEASVTQAAWRQLRSTIRKEIALTDDRLIQDPHNSGNRIILGNMFKYGGVSWETVDDPESRFSIHPQAYLAASNALLAQWTEFALKGEITPYLTFARESIEAIPDAVIQRVIKTQRAYAAPYQLDFGDRNRFYASASIR